MDSFRGGDCRDRRTYFSGVASVSVVVKEWRRVSECFSCSRRWHLLCAGVLFVAIVVFTRYVSLGSIVAAATIPLFVWLQSVFVVPVADLRPLLTAAIVGGAADHFCAPRKYWTISQRH